MGIDRLFFLFFSCCVSEEKINKGEIVKQCASVQELKKECKNKIVYDTIFSDMVYAFSRPFSVFNVFAIG